jgi:hypothetical protein
VNLRSHGVAVLSLMSLVTPVPFSVALWSLAFSFAAASAIVFVFHRAYGAL